MNIPYTKNELKFIEDLKLVGANEIKIRRLLENRLKMLDAATKPEQKAFFKRRSKELARKALSEATQKMEGQAAKAAVENTPAQPPVPQDWISKHQGNLFGNGLSYWEESGWAFAGAEIELAPGNEENKKTLLLQRCMGVVEGKLNLLPGIGLQEDAAKSFYSSAGNKLYCLYCVNRSKLISDYFKRSAGLSNLLLVKLAKEIEEQLNYLLLKN